MVAAAAPLADADVPVRNRVALLCGVGLAGLTVLVVLAAMVVALVR